jgi:hypothetical protein
MAFDEQTCTIFAESNAYHAEKQVQRWKKGWIKWKASRELLLK